MKQELLPTIERLEREISELKRTVKSRESSPPYGIEKRWKNRLLVLLAALFALAMVGLAMAAEIPHSFGTGGVISATRFKENFTHIVNRLWDKSGDDLYYAEGNVGIGTTSPTQKVNIKGSLGKPASSGTTQNGMFRIETSGVPVLDMGADDATPWGMWLQSTGKTDLSANYPLYLNPNGGNVGIGTTSPATRLHVNAGADNNGATATLRVQNTTGYMLMDSNEIDAAPNADLFLNNNSTGNVVIASGGGSVGIGAASSKKFSVSGSSNGNYVAEINNTANGTEAHGLRMVAGYNGSTTVPAFIGFFRPDGTYMGGIWQDGSNGISYSTGSDKRLKENIVDTHYSLDDLKSIKVCDFNWKNDKSKKTTTGLVAQEIYDIYPEAVSKPQDDENGWWALDYGRLTPIIIKTVQEQQEIIETLKADNAELKSRIAALERK